MIIWSDSVSIQAISSFEVRYFSLPNEAAVTILKRLNRLRVTLAVDGYMFRQHPTFYKQMLRMMTELMPKHMTVRRTCFYLKC